MRQVFSIFFRAEGTAPFIVLLCLIIGGLAEAVGIGTLLPALTNMLGEQGGSQNLFERYLDAAMTYAGIPKTLGGLVLTIVAVMFLRSLMLFCAMTYAGLNAARLTVNIRKRLIAAIFGARWNYYASLSGGRAANALSGDASRAGDAYTAAARAVACSALILAYIAVGLAINWRATAFGVAGGILILLVANILIKRSRRAGFKQVDRISDLTTEVGDMLLNIKPLRSMHRHEKMLDGLATILAKLRRAILGSFVARYGVDYGSEMMVVLLIAGGVWAAHVAGGIGVQELVVFALLVYQVISYSARFLKQYQVAVNLQGAFVRLKEFTAQAEANAEKYAGTKTPNIGEGCSFRNVTFAHEDREIIRAANLEIPAKKITVLQGPSGAGKTTLVDLLIGFHQPGSGTVHIGEDDIRDVDIVKWRKKIGYVPQELVLFHDTARANISLYEADISDDKIWEALERAGAAAFVRDLPSGLDTNVGELGGRLSGGQRQRLSLARALVHDPELLILDEVSSALDPESEAAIVQNIAGLRGRYTIVAITHRLAWTTIADKLYTIDKGHVTMRGMASKKENA